MKENSLILTILIVVCISSISIAQSSTKVGIGVALIDMQQIFEAQISEGGFFSSTITVPMDLSPSFRLEPEIGFASASDEFKLNDFISEESSTSWKIGAGIFGLNKYDVFTLYYGGRVGYVTQTLKEVSGSDSDELSSSGFYVAPAIGGEHYFSDHFSLGGEAQFVYTSIGTTPDEGDWEQDLSVFNTRVLVFIRFFF
jgi:hypothetical protein